MSKELTATIRIEDGHNARARGTDALFDCPVIKLVSYVFEKFPERAFEILRRPISLSWSPEPISHSLIQVLAKRWTLDPVTDSIQFIPEKRLEPKLNSQQVSFREQWVGQQLPSSRAEQMALLQSAEKLVSVLEKRHQSSRPIATILANEKGMILSVGWNLRSQNRLWHSELVAVHALSQLPSEQKICSSLSVYTSLQPCRMCASYLLRAASELNVTMEVFYLEPDDGPKAKNTGLEKCQRPFSGSD